MLSIARRLGLESLQNRPVLGNTETLVRYCRLRLQDPKIEQFHIFFLDGHYQIIMEEIHQTGTIDQTAVYPREIIKKALAHGATWLLLTHNHPSGNCTPSQADIHLTQHIIEAGSKLGIHVYDHLVISTTSYVSIKDSHNLPGMG